MWVPFFTNACDREQMCHQCLSRTNGYQLVHPVPACNLVFKTSKLNKCSSQMIMSKEVVHSVKIASTQLREPTEEEQEDFFLKLSQLDHKASILSIHHNFNKPFIPISQSRSLPEPSLRLLMLMA